MTDTPNPADSTPPNTPPTDAVADPADIEKNKVMAVLAYLGILVLVPILAAKDSKFARYHANQGLILFITWIAVMVVVGCPLTLFQIFVHIKFLGCCLDLVPFALFIGLLVLAIMGIINAVNGVMKPLPVIGSYTILK